MAGDAALFIAAVGLTTVWPAWHLRMRGGQRLLASFNHVPLAVAAPAFGYSRTELKEVFIEEEVH